MYSFSYVEPASCSMSSSSCCFLTYIQISEEAGQLVWYSHICQNFLQFIVILTVKGFGIVNKGEIDVFLEFSCFFDDPADVGNLISSSSAFSKTSLNIWKFMVHVSLKPGLENFEHYFASMWDECNCVVVWVFFGIVRHSLAYVRQKVLTVLKKNIQTLQDLKEWAGEFSGWLWSLLGGSFSWRGWFGAG